MCQRQGGCRGKLNSRGRPRLTPVIGLPANPGAKWARMPRIMILLFASALCSEHRERRINPMKHSKFESVFGQDRIVIQLRLCSLLFFTSLLRLNICNFYNERIRLRPVYIGVLLDIHYGCGGCDTVNFFVYVRRFVCRSFDQATRNKHFFNQLLKEISLFVLI